MLKILMMHGLGHMGGIGDGYIMSMRDYNAPKSEGTSTPRAEVHYRYYAINPSVHDLFSLNPVMQFHWLLTVDLW